MDVIERLLLYFEKIGLSTYAAEQKLEFSNGYFNNTKRNNGSIGHKKLEKIFYTFPDLNIHWVLTGDGEMTRKGYFYKQDEPLQVNEAIQATYSTTEMINLLSRKILEMEKEISDLKKTCKFDQTKKE